MPQRLFLAFGQYEVPFSLRGYLKPPETLDDFKDRLGSIRLGVVDFATGKTTQVIRDAIAFFKIGATTEEKAPATELESSQRFAHEMERMFDIPTNDPVIIFKQN